MAVRPILFSGPMVRALLEGRKTQTRRVLKPQPEIFQTSEGPCEVSINTCDYRSRPRLQLGRVITKQEIPYAVGDALWVREQIWQASPYPGTLPCGEPDESCRWSSRLVHYAADGDPPNCHNRHYGPDGLRGGMFAAPDPYATWQKRPSIHMPRWASRLTLEVTGVKVERLQDMEGQHPSDSDAIAEGVNAIHHGDGAYYYSAFRDHPDGQNYCDPADAFRELWDSINGAGSWDSNPWIVAVTFTVHQQNVDAFLGKKAAA